jgi:Flp pilus assembly protein TadB
MFSIPNPLHPAIVHFPIVLLLIGAAVAVVCVFVSRWHLAWVAAALLALGAVGSFFAVKTGDSAKESLGELPPAVETLVDAHEKWAERTEIVGAVAAALAIGAAVLGTLAASSRRRKRASASDSMESMAEKMSKLKKAADATTLQCRLDYTSQSRANRPRIGRQRRAHGVLLCLSDGAPRRRVGLRPRRRHEIHTCADFRKGA